MHTDDEEMENQGIGSQNIGFESRVGVFLIKYSTSKIPSP